MLAIRTHHGRPVVASLRRSVPLAYNNTPIIPELSMGWTDPRVGLSWVEIFQFFGGLGWVGSITVKVLKIGRDYVNSFKERSDKIWLRQTIMFVSCTGLGRVGSKFFNL